MHFMKTLQILGETFIQLSRDLKFKCWLTRAPLIWFLCIIRWNSSSILLYLASVRGVRLKSASWSLSSPQGLPRPPLVSFLFKAWQEQHLWVLHCMNTEQLSFYQMTLNFEVALGDSRSVQIISALGLNIYHASVAENIQELWLHCSKQTNNFDWLACFKKIFFFPTEAEVLCEAVSAMACRPPSCIAHLHCTPCQKPYWHATRSIQRLQKRPTSHALSANKVQLVDLSPEVCLHWRDRWRMSSYLHQ